MASQSCASEVETADQIAASLEDEINEVTKKINEAKALLKEQEVYSLLLRKPTSSLSI